MKALIAAALAASALAAYAGEDSTHRAGPGGTGASFWEVPGGLQAFANAEAGNSGPQRLACDMSPEHMHAMTEQHGKDMDEMMTKMQAKHGAMTGGTHGGAAPAAGDR